MRRITAKTFYPGMKCPDPSIARKVAEKGYCTVPVELLDAIKASKKRRPKPAKD